jgi:RNA polymerase-binding transcription factor DksA
MPRRDALLRLAKTLLARRTDQHKRPARLHEATYGTCEGCGKRILLARSNGLPDICLDCERLDEEFIADLARLWQIDDER